MYFRHDIRKLLHTPKRPIRLRPSMSLHTHNSMFMIYPHRFQAHLLCPVPRHLSRWTIELDPSRRYIVVFRVCYAQDFAGKDTEGLVELL